MYCFPKQTAWIQIEELRVPLYQYKQVVNGGLFNCNRMGGKAIVLHAAEGKFCPVAAFQSIKDVKAVE